MTKLDEELESLFDFSEEQLQEREHHFLKKMWVSAGIIVAVLIALSVSTFAMFSTSKTIASNEELVAKEFSVTCSLKDDSGNDINNINNIEGRRICDIGLYNIKNDNGTNNKEFELSITPTGTLGVQGYCKISGVDDKDYYVVVGIDKSQQENNVKTVNIVLQPNTTATVKVEFSWATLNTNITPLNSGGTIPVPSTEPDENEQAKSSDDNNSKEKSNETAKNNEPKNGQSETPVENETNEEPSSSEPETTEPATESPQSSENPSDGTD